MLCGCFEAYIPLERFSPQDMQELPKLRDPDTQRRIISAIAAQRVHRLNLGFIVGTPTDSPTDIEFASEAAAGLGALISTASSGASAVQYLPLCSVPLPGTPNRSRYRPHIRYDLDAFPELHNNYISVVESADMRPIDFTEARRTLDETLNGRRAQDGQRGACARHDQQQSGFCAISQDERRAAFSRSAVCS